MQLPKGGPRVSSPQQGALGAAPPVRAGWWDRGRAWLEHYQVYFTTLAWVCLTAASVVVAIVSLRVSGTANGLAGRANTLLEREARVMEAQLQPNLEVRRDTAGGSDGVVVTNHGGYLGSPEFSVGTYLGFSFHSADRRVRLGPEMLAITEYWSSTTTRGATEGVVFEATADSARVGELARRDKSLAGIDVPAVGGRPAGALVRWGHRYRALTAVVLDYTDALGEEHSRGYALSGEEAAAAEGWNPMGGGVSGSSAAMWSTPLSMAPRIPVEGLDAAAIREAYISEYTEYPMKAGKAAAGVPRLVR